MIFVEILRNHWVGELYYKKAFVFEFKYVSKRVVRRSVEVFVEVL